ncbi:MAG: carboxymuconolactone decarboxylase family protein [Actinomycetes bacterium]
MAPLPPLPEPLPNEVRNEMNRMAAVRSHAEGTENLGAVYQTLFHNPALARSVGSLGEAIRFRGDLPDDIRELIILRYAVKAGFGYEWSHHQRAARQAGLPQTTIRQLVAGELPPGLREEQRAAVIAVDAVVAKQSIPSDAQAVLIDHVGQAGIVELVVACGLYAIMGYTVTAFEVPLDPGFPKPPF